VSALKVRGLTVVPDPECLAQVAAERIAGLASSAMAERGRFVVALSGGSTPRPTYRLLAKQKGGERHPGGLVIDWSRVEVFWGDERCVPPDHPDSNYRMARRELLARVQIPTDQVHRIKGELPPHEAAATYRADLEAVLGVKWDRHTKMRTRLARHGRFDLVLLGLGRDGHTASLFPGTPAVEERRQGAVAVYVEKLDAWRVTLTLPIINEARQVVFLVSGAKKADTLARVHAGERLPAALVQPTEGTLAWLVDRDAAAALPPLQPERVGDAD
jgi:6-phosphogluconolactonase